MNQTLSLYSIRAKWRDALKNSDELESFCQTNFGKSPKIFMSINIHHMPGEDDCPLIIIGDGTKDEGEVETLAYNIAVSAVIVNENSTITDNVIEYDGVKQIDDLCQLIYSILFAVSPDYPIAKFSFETNSTDIFPSHVGDMDFTIEIPFTLGGGAIEY